MCSSCCHSSSCPGANLSPLLSVRVRWADLWKWEFRQHFLAFYCSAVRNLAHSRGADMGEMSPSPHYELACLPQYTHLPWLKTNDAHKHTWRRESMLVSQRLQSGTIIAHTICLQSSQCALISSLLPYLSLSLSLASSPSPLPSKQPRVACQGSKLLALSGL